ncbi:MAG: hypothetical protein WCS15_05980 [Prevotella sp.]
MSAIKSIDQDLFDTLFLLSQSLKYATYDVRPPKSADYPFVQIGDVQLVPRAAGDRLVGSLFTTIELFGRREQRKLLSEMTEAIFMRSINLRRTTSYGIAANVKGCSKQMIKDTSVPNTTLWHSVVELEYRIL